MSEGQLALSIFGAFTMALLAIATAFLWINGWSLDGPLAIVSGAIYGSVIGLALLAGLGGMVVWFFAWIERSRT